MALMLALLIEDSTFIIHEVDQAVQRPDCKVVGQSVQAYNN